MRTQKMHPVACLCSVWVLFLLGGKAFSVSPCQLALDGDLNRDCKVDLVDLSWLASYWLTDWSTEPVAFLPEGIYVAPPESGGFDGAGCGGISGPCATVSYGIMRAGASAKNYVFVADGVYQETVTMTNGVNLWGGFDSQTWVRKEPAQTNSVLIGVPSGSHAKTLIANMITSASEVSRFQIKGAEVQNPGGNSYAVWVKDSTTALVLKDNLIYLGRGGDGANGADGIDGIDGPDGLPGVGASNAMGSVVAGEWVGASGTAGTDAVSGGKGGAAGGAAFGIFINNAVPGANRPSLLNNMLYAGRGGKGGYGGFGGIGEETGAGGGGGGGAGGMACGIYTNNVSTNPFYQNSNTFMETNAPGSGGRGGKSFGNSGTEGVTGAALNYHYQ